MRRHFSLLFAVVIFTALSIFATPIRAQGNITLDVDETNLVLADSENAHEAAKYAFDTITCIMVSLNEEVDWTPRDCVDKLREVMDPLSTEHRLLHPALDSMLIRKYGSRS